MSATTRTAICIAVGGAVGFLICQFLAEPPSAPVPVPAACTQPTGTDQVVNVDVNQGTVVVDHDPVVVRVNECEQIVWKFDTSKFSRIKVVTKWNKKADPRAVDPFNGTPTPPNGPPNPFPGTFTPSSAPATFEASSNTGALASNLPLPATAGHEYHFKITLTLIQGNTELELDPHGRFD